MYSKILLTLLIFLPLSVMAISEQQIFSWYDFHFLAEGNRFNVVRILENGDILLVTNPTKGKPAVLLRQNVFSRKSSQFTTPVTEFSHIAANRNGKEVVIYGNNDRTLWHLNLNNKQSRLLHKKEMGKSGWGLYGGQKSRLEYNGNHLYIWAYRYDKENRFTGDFLLKLQSPKKDTSKFKKLLGGDELLKIAKKYHPSFNKIGAVNFSRKYLTFAALTAEGEGKLIGFNFITEESFVIDKFSLLLEVVLTISGNYLAYIKKKKKKKSKKGSLYIYDMNKKRRQKVLSGILHHLVFNPKGNKLAVGRLIWDKQHKKVNQEIVMIQRNSGAPHKVFPLIKEKLYLDWQFVNQDKALVLFDGKSIHLLNFHSSQ